jgi:hypothetical protein
MAMTEEEKQHYLLYGKYGYVRTKDCKSCNGSGNGRGGEDCSDCICGSCTGEKHYCNACDAEHDFTERDYKFGELFEFDYIDEDFGTDKDNSIIYKDVKLLQDIGQWCVGDILDEITFSAARGVLIIQKHKSDGDGDQSHDEISLVL